LGCDPSATLQVSCGSTRSTSQCVRQIRADQVAAVMIRASQSALSISRHTIRFPLASVLLDQLRHAVAAPCGRTWCIRRGARPVCLRCRPRRRLKTMALCPPPGIAGASTPCRRGRQLRRIVQCSLRLPGSVGSEARRLVCVCVFSRDIAGRGHVRRRAPQAIGTYHASATCPKDRISRS
jgi:hypothetical protein